jgi:hypothetical protein
MGPGLDMGWLITSEGRLTIVLCVRVCVCVCACACVYVCVRVQHTRNCLLACVSKGHNTRVLAEITFLRLE